MTDRSATSIFMALVLGLGGGVLGTYAWLREAPPAESHGDHDGHDDHEEEFERGPHGGRLLSKDDFALEVTIYERGVPPQFRVYAFENGKPIAPDDVDLTIRLLRLGGRIDDISFRAEGEYLRGVKIVEEPHSFDVEVTAERLGKSFSWRYATYEGRVVLSPEAVRNAGIEVREAAGGRIAQTLSLRGEIVPNADRVAHIVPRVSGQVREVRKHLGDQVRAGDVLAVIDSRELAETKAGDLAAEARLSLLRASLERVEKLFEKKIATEEELLKARQELAEAEIAHRTAEAKLHALGLSEAQVRALHEEPDVDYSRYEIKAPLDATIIKKHVTLGEVVGPESDVFVLADLSTVWVHLTVYQRDAAAIRSGQAVTVSFHDDTPDANGMIDYITPIVDETTRTATARVVLNNPDGSLRPGLFVTASLVVDEADVAVAVPTAAVQRFRDWSVVFVKYGDAFEVRPLELGRRDGTRVEVVQGLSPGEAYVAANSFVLKAELGKSGAGHHH
ncbi:MAG: efflux RND transporter periplasmic adaptor subunit [Phycisphaerae bacterium]